MFINVTRKTSKRDKESNPINRFHRPQLIVGKGDGIQIKGFLNKTLKSYLDLANKDVVWAEVIKREDSDTFYLVFTDNPGNIEDFIQVNSSGNIRNRRLMNEILRNFSIPEDVAYYYLELDKLPSETLMEIERYYNSYGVDTIAIYHMHDNMQDTVEDAISQDAVSTPVPSTGPDNTSAPEMEALVNYAQRAGQEDSRNAISFGTLAMDSITSNTRLIDDSDATDLIFG